MVKKKCNQGYKNNQDPSIKFWRAATVFSETLKCPFSKYTTFIMNKSRPTRFQWANKKCSEEMRNTTATLQGENARFWHFQQEIPGQSCNSLKERLQGQGKKCKDKEEHKGQKGQGSDILLGMWKPEVNAHSYKQQASRNSKELHRKGER